MEYTGSDYSALDRLIERYLNAREVAASTSAKSHELASARQNAAEAAYIAAVADLLTQERIDFYRPLFEQDKFLPVVPSYDIRREMMDAKADYVLTGDSSKKEEIYKRLCISLRSHWIQMEDHIEKLRRSKILSGELDPESSDIGWLQEERERLSSVVDPYDAALEKLKVNH